MTIACFYK